MSILLQKHYFYLTVLALYLTLIKRFGATIIEDDPDSHSTHHLFRYSLYPNHVPRIPVRKDSVTKQPVSRGRFQRIGGLFEHEVDPGVQKLTLAEMRRELQCSSWAADLQGKRGSLSLLEIAPPTKLTVEQVAAWVESKHDATSSKNWKECHRLRRAWLKDPPQEFVHGSWASQIGLFRVINGSLFYDWPWGRQRFDSRFSDTWMLHRMLRVLLDRGTTHTIPR
jgi:hypothetical protein